MSRTTRQARRGRLSRWPTAITAACLLGLVATAGAAQAGSVTPARSARAQVTAARSGRSQAPPENMSPATHHLMLAQIPLDNAATRIRRVAAGPGAGHDGLVQIAVDDAAHRLTVYWHGKVPADLRRLLDSLSRHLTIRVVAARYSAAELSQAVSQVMQARSGLSITQAGPLTDGSGIRVGVAGAVPAISRLRALRLRVPVTLIHRSAARAATCYATLNQTVGSDNIGQPSRCDDLSPGFWGGAVLINANHGNGCSTGFGMHSTVDSKTYLVTASHCGNLGEPFLNGQLGETVGSVYLEKHSHDDAAVLANSGNQYYDGAGIYQGDTHHSKFVGGEQPSNVGDLLCESGAYGGVMCGIQVFALNLTMSYLDEDTGTTITVVNVAEMSKGFGGDNNGFLTPGDSGGPVFSLASNNRVTAKGINLAIDASDNYYMTIDWVSADFKVTVNTG
jgi:hypothetical protein